MDTRRRAARRRPGRWVMAGLALGAVLAAGASVVAAPSAGWADPTPAPAPTVPKPTPTPRPNPPTTTPTPTPTPTPAPSPQPAPTPPPPSQDKPDDDPAWYDVSGQVRKAIREFFADLVKDNINSVMETLGTTLLSSPDLTADERVRALWSANLVITNTVFVLFIVAAGFVVASRETLQSRHGLKQILPRLAVAAVAANTSLLVCSKLLWATNALTAAIAGQGIDAKAAGESVSQSLKTAQNGNNFLLSLLCLAVLVATIVVVITFIMRVACLVLLIGFAPLALVCHALPQTEGLAYTWWRAMGACLGIQLAQAAIVLGAIRIFFTPAGPTVLGAPASKDGLMKVLICLCMLWILIKIPGWMKQFVLGPIGQRGGRGPLGQLVHTYMMIKTLGMASGVLKGSSAARRATAATRAGKPGTATRPRAGARSRTAATSGARRRVRPAAPGAVRRAAVPGAPVFSSAPQPATPSPVPDGPPVPVRFSSDPAPQPAQSSPPRRASSPVRFSDTPGPVSSPTPAAGTPAVTFSSAPAAQRAPRRGPSPSAPAFSPAPPAPAAGTGTGRTSPRTTGTPPPASSRSGAQRPVPSPAPKTTGRARAPSASPSPPAGTASARPARRRPSKE